jgi:hypothetical protein
MSLRKILFICQQDMQFTKIYSDNFFIFTTYNRENGDKEISKDIKEDFFFRDEQICQH